MNVNGINNTNIVPFGRKVEKPSDGSYRQSQDKFIRQSSFQELKNKLDAIRTQNPETNKPLLDSRIAVALASSGNQNRQFSLSVYKSQNIDIVRETPAANRGIATDIEI